MKFLLENNGESWPNCTLEELGGAVLEMLGDEHQFVVLTPERPVSERQVRFMQAALWGGQGVRVDFSLRVDDKWRMAYRFYRDGEEVLRLFEGFYLEGAIPDLTDYELEERVFPD